MYQRQSIAKGHEGNITSETAARKIRESADETAPEKSKLKIVDIRTVASKKFGNFFN